MLHTVRFQFQIGAIKSPPVEMPTEPTFDGFNSKLVRLKDSGVGLGNKEIQDKFQFQIGAIKSE